jgi:hypothetical protein
VVYKVEVYRLAALGVSEIDLNGKILPDSGTSPNPALLLGLLQYRGETMVHLGSE